MILMLALVSCTTYENHYDEPGVDSRLNYPKYIIAGANDLLSVAVGAVDNAVKLDEWIKASTDEERDNIEDRYFMHYKIRSSNDTISLNYIPDENPNIDIKFITKGYSIIDYGVEWSLDGYNSNAELIIRRIDDNEWKVLHNSLGFYGLECELDIKRLTDTTYSVTGSGMGSAEFCDNNPTVGFEIVEPLTVNSNKLDDLSMLICMLDDVPKLNEYYYNNDIYNPDINYPEPMARRWGVELVFLSGKMVIEEQFDYEREKYPATIEVDAEGVYNIHYRGVSGILFDSYLQLN